MFTFEIIMYPHTLMSGNYRSTTSTRLSLASPSSTLRIPGQQNKGKGAAPVGAHRSPTSPSLRPPTSRLYPAKVSAAPFRVAERSLRNISLAFRENIFSIHSPCSSFAIAATRPGHPTTSSQQRSRWTTNEGNLGTRA